MIDDSYGLVSRRFSLTRVYCHSEFTWDISVGYSYFTFQSDTQLRQIGWQV